MIKRYFFVFTVLAVLLFAGMTGKALGDASDQLEQAHTYEKNGQYGQAEAVYRQVAAGYPGSDEAFAAQKSLTILYILREKRSEAKGAWEKLVADFADNERLSEGVNQIVEKCRRSQKGEKVWQVCRGILEETASGEHGIWSQMGLAILDIKLGDQLAAQDDIDKLLSDFSGDEHSARAIGQVGWAYRQLRNYTKAREVYQYVVDNLSDRTGSVFSHRSLAYCNIALGDKTAAWAGIDKLLGDYSDYKGIASMAMRLGDACRRQFGESEEARRLYEHCLEHWPEHRSAMWAQRGTVFLDIQAGDYEAADAGIEVLVAEYGDHNDLPKAFKWLGDDYDKAKEYGKALKVYEYVVDNWAESNYAFGSQKGVILSNIKLEDDPNTNAAIDELFARFSEREDIAKAATNLGDECRRKLEGYGAARRLYEGVLAGSPDDEHAMWAQRGIVFLDIQAGDYEAADAGIETMLAKYPDHNDLPKAFQWLGDDYLKVGQYDKASNCYQYVIDKQLDDRWAISSRVGIARVKISLGDDEAAEEVLDNLIADYNDHPRFSWAIFAVADEYYNQAIQRKRAGHIDRGNEDYRKAIAVWEKMARESPSSPKYTPRAYYCAAVCYSQELKEYIKGIEHYQRIVDDWPDYKYAWHAQYFIGKYYESLRDSGGIPESEADLKIQQAYQAVVEKYPDSQSAPFAALKLGQINLAKRQWPDVAYYLELFVYQEDGEKPYFLFTGALYDLGQAYEQLDMLDRAIEVYGVFMQTADPDDSRIKTVKAKLEKFEGVKK